MSVLDWFRTRLQREKEHLIYLPVPAERVSYTDGKQADATALKAGEQYFRLWLVQMFLKNDRAWFASWHPAVHSAVTFTFGSETQVVTNVAGPSQLKDVKPDNLDRFITFNRPLTTLLPFNGGTVAVDAGLLAMQGQNDVRDLIKVMGDFGSLLAVPQLSATVKIAAPLAEAVGSLVGATNGTVMLGLNQTFSSEGGGAEAVLRAGYYAVVDATEKELPPEKFGVHADQLWHGDDRMPLTGFNYLLFRIERRDTRDDWDALTTIREPYAEAVKTLQLGNVEQAEAHLRRAITAALNASELTKNVDRRLVVTQLKTRFEQDKKDLGAGAFRRRRAPTLKELMHDPIMTPVQAARKGELKQREAFAGLD